MPFEKGHKFSPGRTPGSENKLNAEAREILTKCVTAELTEAKFKEHLEAVPPEKRLDILQKYLHFILPKLQNISGERDFSSLSPEQTSEILRALAEENKKS